MNKKHFISILETRLSPLPPEEREELINDVEAHFNIGLQNGRTEEDIARELGDPFEIAREALGDRYIDMPVDVKTGYSMTGQIFILIGLFFCALVAVPFLLSLWSGAAAVAASAAAMLVSPLLLLVDYVYNGSYQPAKLFLSISLTGAGILLFYGVLWIFKGLLALSRGYLIWNIRLMKGRTIR